MRALRTVCDDSRANAPTNFAANARTNFAANARTNFAANARTNFIANPGTNAGANARADCRRMRRMLWLLLSGRVVQDQREVEG